MTTSRLDVARSAYESTCLGMRSQVCIAVRRQMEGYFEYQENTPFSKEVVERYNPTIEDNQARNNALDNAYST